MKAIVDKDACVGCGLCANTCPEVFEMQEDKAIVLGSSIPNDALECAKEATSSCPVEAIKLQ